MRLTVNRNDFWNGIEIALDSISSKPPMPILNNILIEATPDGLFLAATDMEMSVQTEMDAEVKEIGITTIPARKMAEIVKEWHGENINIEVIDNRMTMFGVLDEEDGEARYTLSGIDADEYPEVPVEIDGVDLVLGGGEQDPSIIADMIEKTGFCVSVDGTRQFLSGVLWRIDAHGVEMVATDGNRLSCYRLELDLSEQLEEDQQSDIIVPPKALSEIVDLLTDCKEKVYITVGESRLLINVGDTYLCSRLIEGPYVNYAMVIPQNNTKELIINRDHFLAAVRRVSILTSTFTRSIRLMLTEGWAELSASNSEVGGEAVETLSVQYHDEDMDVCYNAQYLMDALRRMSSDTVALQLHNHVTAAIMTPTKQEEGEDYFCLLMPLKPIDAG